MEQPEVTSQPAQSWTGVSTDTSVAASTIVAAAATLPPSIIIPCEGGYLVVRRTRQYAVRSASSPITQPTATSRLRELLARLQHGGSTGLGMPGGGRPSGTFVGAAPSQLSQPTAQQWPPYSSVGPALVAQSPHHSVTQGSQQHPLVLPQHEQQPPHQQQWQRQRQQLAVEPAASCSPFPMPCTACGPQQPATSSSSGRSSSGASISPAAIALASSILQPPTPLPETQASRLS